MDTYYESQWAENKASDITVKSNETNEQLASSKVQNFQSNEDFATL